MKPSQFTIPVVTGALGLALGLALPSSFRKPEGAAISESSARKLKSGNHADAGSAPAEVGAKTAVRTRARDRGEDKKPKEPRVSIPLKTLVQILKNNDFSYTSEFDSLDHAMGKALVLLGATETEQDNIKKVIQTSKSEILAAEKTHVKLGEVSSDLIQMDMSGMRGPAEEIAGRTKDGIRAALPADLAEGLISAINWKKYYPVDDKSFTRLEITRGRSGKLTAWERSSNGGMGHSLDAEFQDDGTPLPAERIFNDRWKPFLKGVTILPKDEP